MSLAAFRKRTSEGKDPPPTPLPCARQLFSKNKTLQLELGEGAWATFARKPILLSKSRQAPNLTPEASHVCLCTCNASQPFQDLKHRNDDICAPLASHWGKPVEEAAGAILMGLGTVAASGDRPRPAPANRLARAAGIHVGICCALRPRPSCLVGKL